MGEAKRRKRVEASFGLVPKLYKRGVDGNLFLPDFGEYYEKLGVSYRFTLCLLEAAKTTAQKSSDGRHSLAFIPNKILLLNCDAPVAPIFQSHMPIELLERRIPPPRNRWGSRSGRV
jgi:hypothetical protein